MYVNMAKNNEPGCFLHLPNETLPVRCCETGAGWHRVARIDINGTPSARQVTDRKHNLPTPHPHKLPQTTLYWEGTVSAAEDARNVRLHVVEQLRNLSGRCVWVPMGGAHAWVHAGAHVRGRFARCARRCPSLSLSPSLHPALP